VRRAPAEVGLRRLARTLLMLAPVALIAAFFALYFKESM